MSYFIVLIIVQPGIRESANLWTPKIGDNSSFRGQMTLQKGCHCFPQGVGSQREVRRCCKTIFYRDKKENKSKKIIKV